MKRQVDNNGHLNRNTKLTHDMVNTKDLYALLMKL